MRLLEPKFRQLRPARIGLALVSVLRAGGVQIDPADRAQAGAILAAQEVCGHAQRERIACPGVQIEHAVLDIRRDEIVAVGLVLGASVYGGLATGVGSITLPFSKNCTPVMPRLLVACGESPALSELPVRPVPGWYPSPKSSRALPMVACP